MSQLQKLQATQIVHRESSSMEEALQGQRMVINADGGIALPPCTREAAILLTNMPALLPVRQGELPELEISQNPCKLTDRLPSFKSRCSFYPQRTDHEMEDTHRSPVANH